MPFSISNSGTLGTLNKISKADRGLASSFEKLAGGKSINSAADNAAGLAISEQLRSQVSSIDQATQNISAGGAMLRTAEGGLGQIGDLLSRGRELAVQSANGTLSARDRKAIDAEFTNIKSEIDRITQTTEFNGQSLLTGEMGPASQNPIAIQAGIKDSPNDRITINEITATDTASLGVNNLSLDTPANAQNAIQGIDNAISAVTQNRANVGALVNRLGAAASNLAVTKENLGAAENQIRGLDYAAETSDRSRNQVLSQAGVSALNAGLKSQEKSIGALLNIKG